MAGVTDFGPACRQVSDFGLGTHPPGGKACIYKNVTTGPLLLAASAQASGSSRHKKVDFSHDFGA